MRKRALAFLSLAVCLSPLAAEISVGGSVGCTYTVDNLSNLESLDYSITRTDVPFFAEAGWKTSFGTGMTTVREIVLVAGLRAGSLDILTTESPAGLDVHTDIELGTTPLFGFIRAETGYGFADFAVGVHFWDIRYATESSDMGDNGYDAGFSFSAGPRLPLFGHLVLRAGPSIAYYSIPEFSGNLSANSLVAGFFAGLNAEF